MCGLLAHARALTKEPGLGYHLGFQTRATLFGYLGFAGLSAATLGDALQIALTFAPLFSTALRMDLSVDNRTASLTFEECTDFGSVRDVVLISTIVGTRELTRSVTGRDTGGSADFALPEPAYHARFQHLAPYARFDQPFNRLRFDAAFLKFPVVTADPTALELARQQCERALDELRYSADLSNRITHVLAHDDSNFESLKDFATYFGLSTRTLRRRLTAEGVSFLDLVGRARRDKATRLLRYSSLSITEIGDRVGYAKTSGFVRAFRRWTGVTPAQFRRSIRTS